MAGQSYNFTFQNQNPTSGWTGPSLAQTAASLYDNPFDPVDPSQAIQDQTEADPTATGDIAITDVAQGQALLKRTASLLKNLEKQSKKAADLDTMKYLNGQIVEVQKEQIRIQGELTKLGVAGTTTKKAGVGGGDSGLNSSIQAQAAIEKKIAKDNTKLTQQQHNLTAHTSSIDALKSAIASTTDPKVLDHLNKQLQKEQKTFSKEQSKVQAQTSHLTELQTRLTALNPPATTPPVTTTPVVPGTTPATGTSTSPVAGVTINPKTGVAWTAAEIALAAAHPGQANYFDELVDKTLASRAGVSGWHSVGGALPAATVPVVPPVTPVGPAPVVPVVTPPVVPGAPVVPTAPPRALTAKEIAWRAKFDPRGWANSAGILTPVTPAPVLSSPPPPMVGASGWN